MLKAMQAAAASASYRNVVLNEGSSYGLLTTISITMNSGYPEVTEQDPLLQSQPVKRQERLATFVMELWAQHRLVAEARRSINKKWADKSGIRN